MTDQTIPADKVREIIHVNTFRRVVMPHCRASIIDQLEALLPAPPRPTLADMTDEERAACQWMQADVKGYEITAGIIAKINPTDAHLIASDGETWFLELDTVTPRPDLPRMEWPGNQKPAPTPALPGGWRLADHWDHGRVIVTTPTPNSGGNVYFVLPDSLDNRGYGWGYCPPDDLTYIDQKAGDANPVKVGDVIESAADPRIAALPDGTILRDCDGEEVVKRGGDWAGLGYIPRESEGTEFGPWTVRRIGWEADQ